MKIYIVRKGEEYEGDDIIGAFNSKENAEKFALNQPCCINHAKCNHEPWESHKHGDWENPGESFSTGSQYMEIDEWEVK